MPQRLSRRTDISFTAVYTPIAPRPSPCRPHNIIRFTCQIYDVFHSPSFVHVVMDYGGLDLYELIETMPVSTTASQNIVLRLILALEHCLENGVVHRDLKPENVLVQIEMTTPAECLVKSVKLCDFGLCAIAPISPTFESHEHIQQHRRAEVVLGAAGIGTSVSSPTSLGEIQTPTVSWGCDKDVVSRERNWIFSDFQGSPGFVAPEVVTETSYDGRFVDLFALGCVLLNLALGHKKFEKKWLRAFRPEVMVDKCSFTSALHSALAQLQKLPLFSTTASPDSSPRCVMVSQQPTFTEIGNLMFGLLEVDPQNRMLIGMAHHHCWLASASTGKDEKTAQMQVARIVA